MTRLYDAGWQGRKVRMVIWGTFLFAGVMFSLALLDPKVPPPPEIETPAQRMIAKGFAALVGFASVIGILVYGRCYVQRIEQAEDGSLTLRLTGALGSPKLRLTRDSIEGTRYRRGRFTGGDIHVNAPWTSLRVIGRRLPLIVDEQGEFLDPAALAAALEPAPPESLIPPRERPSGPSRRERKRRP
jgi:hypothetical protein